MVRVEHVEGLSDVSPQAWDALAGDDDPFVEHAFLSALERSGTVGGRSGWLPRHVLAWSGERLVGALPLYEKEHSYGEYIFDWAWADAASRAGVRYYPKLVSMVPVTPTTGRRLLVRPDVDRAPVVGALLGGAREALERVGASSIHLNFLEAEERDELVAAGDFMARLTLQFHFHNAGYQNFDDFLSRLRSPARKQIRKERRRVVESGLEVCVVEGPALSEQEWALLPRFYTDTCHRKGSFPYLTSAFFDLLRDTFAHRVVVALARREGAPVAASLAFEKGACLYGRYWGCAQDHELLHFELCYYRLIERAIERRLRRFEAGAQGIHKLKRGLLPARIHSVHLVADPLLRRAVGEFLPREAFAVGRQLEELADHGPFRRGGAR